MAQNPVTPMMMESRRKKRMMMQAQEMPMSKRRIGMSPQREKLMAKKRQGPSQGFKQRVMMS